MIWRGELLPALPRSSRRPAIEEQIEVVMGVSPLRTHPASVHVVGVGTAVLPLRSDVKQSAFIFRRNVRHIRKWLEEESVSAANQGISTHGRSAEMEDACTAVPRSADVLVRLLASRWDLDGLGLEADALRLPARILRPQTRNSMQLQSGENCLYDKGKRTYQIGRSLDVERDLQKTDKESSRQGKFIIYLFFQF
ncbi:hypothetical protein GUJ93_ZPchr0010g7392 [Zizania palustris]|uniref:Uncharacterized protein n=1 Tax=Zizania palustris TaxID=103762 RepID=A0A8J5WFD8_ZIZPA|nr:hypothetical protein GUJ93_ZPchr0010g7392 [Zizania palustris]